MLERMKKGKKQMKIVLTKCHKIKILSFPIWNTDLQQVLNILLEMVCQLLFSALLLLFFFVSSGAVVVVVIRLICVITMMAM